MFLKNIRELKTQMRVKHKKLRMTCPPDVKEKLDCQLTSAFLETDEYKSCETLFAFISTDIEVDIKAIIEKALEDGKRLALPKCRNRQGEMDFYYVTSLSQVEKGAFSLMEPNPEKCEIVTDLSSGLCLVPGLCFDREGYRIGFGKGYYDRFLQDFGGLSAGLCYSRCVERSLPVGMFDKPVDVLITEKYINHIHKIFAKE